jgi:hypothetical protein
LSVPGEAIYRCIDASCGRSMPRRVNYCPYCGAAQLDETAYPGAPARPPEHVVPAHPAVAPAQAGPVPLRGSPHAGAAGQALPSATAYYEAVAPDRPAAGGGDTATPAPLAHEWGASARAAAQPPVKRQQPPQAGAHRNIGPGIANQAGGTIAPPPIATAAEPAPAGPTPARPPQREPIRLRWWLLALAALWMVWFMAKPGSKKIDARIDRAISLATDCKSREAQSELIALRQAKASPEQLQRLQDALNDAAAECRRLKKRSRAYSDAGASAAAPDGAADGVERPRPPANRKGTAHGHPRVIGEP